VEILLNGHKLYGPGEIVEPENKVDDPVVLHINGLNPFRVSRGVLAQQTKKYGWQQGESALIRDQHLINPQPDHIAAIRTIQVAISDKHPVT
jgi:hypothetical protein